MTIITGKHLARRTFLRGMGAAIALPMLDAMRPALAAEPAKAPLRMAFTYIPNGVTMRDWKPAGEGAGSPFMRQPFSQASISACSRSRSARRARLRGAKVPSRLASPAHQASTSTPVPGAASFATKSNSGRATLRP